MPKSNKQFVHFSQDRARAAALLPVDLGRKTMVLSGLSSADCITLRSRINKDLSVILTSLYMDSTKDIPGDLITRVTNAERERILLIAAVDSNAHHTAWGHPSSNQRGRNLLQILSANNLAICNLGNTPTFIGKLGHSVIDLTICNQLGLNLIRDWKVNPSKSLSYHEAISFNLGLSFATRSTSKCDWQLYKELTAAEFNRNPFWFKPVNTAEDLNNRQEFISSTLRRCFNAACPTTRGTFRSSVPWWTAELNTAKQSSKALRHKANRTRNNQDWETYRDAHRIYITNFLNRQNVKIGKSFAINLKVLVP